MRFVFLACLIFGYATQCTATAAPNTVTRTFSPQLMAQLHDCLNRVEDNYLKDPQFEFDIQTHCQQLAQRLSQNGISAYLQQPLEKTLSVEQLMDLQSIGRTINETNAQVYAFNFHDLPALLGDTVQLKQEQDLSWWTRFLNWLADIFERNETKQPNWLKDWLSKLSIPEWFVEAFYTGALILLMILMLVILIVELRAAGIRNWFKRRVQQFSVHQAQSTHNQSTIQLTWEAVGRLPPKQKILVSYQKVLHLLANKNLIPRDSSLTNYELQNCLEKSMGAVQPVFRQLICSVEAALYGDQKLDSASSDQMVRNAEQYADSIIRP